MADGTFVDLTPEAEQLRSHTNPLPGRLAFPA
jgi:hypothetical protein